MAGVRDVAKAAGVSTATVVRVLNGSAKVSEELTRKVLEVADGLDYVRNDVAASLTQGRTRLLGLLVPDIANPFTAQVARGLEDEAARHGFQVLIGSSDFDGEREVGIIESFRGRTVDAAVLFTSPAAAGRISRLRDLGMPLVFVDRRVGEFDDIPLVSTDNAGAARSAVSYLIDLGHTDLGIVSGPSDVPTAQQRLSGFEQACGHAGLKIRQECIRGGALGTEGGYRAMRELLELDRRPTAVFCFNNLTAVGALQALREHGVRVPDELSLVTFDDTDLFPFVDPPITAIEQPAYEIGVEAGRILVSRISGTERQAQDVVLPTEFHIRSSCASPPHLSN